MTLTKTDQAGLPRQQFLNRYIELIAEIPEVIELRLTAEDELYTIMAAAPPANGVRHQVIMAQCDALPPGGPAPLALRLVNGDELPPDGYGEHLSGLGELLWRREAGGAMPYHRRDPCVLRAKALRKYIELVRPLPEVIELRLGENDLLHTVIAVPGDDDAAMHRVIAAEGEMLRWREPMPFDFRIENSLRQPAESREKTRRGLGALVWRR